MESIIAADAVNSSGDVSTLKAFLAACFMFAVHLFVTILLMGFLVRIMPFYGEFFNHFDVALPKPLLFLIKLSVLTSRYWYLILLALFVIDGPLAFGMQFLPRNMQWLRGCWFSSYLLFAIVFLFFSNMTILLVIQALNTSFAGP